jgi:drug/metabolite transporter (DMT)-like permease
MKDYGLLTLAAVLLAVDFAIAKLYQKRAGTSLSAGFAFNALLGLFTALVFWIIGGFSFQITRLSAVMAVLLTVLATSYTLIGFRILRSGSMALYSLFLMTGGMTLPYLWGLFFLDEPFSWLRTAGLCVLMGAVLLSNLPKKGERVNVKLILMCVAIFALNGCVSIASKAHQIEATLPTVDTNSFVILTGLGKVVISGTAFLITKFAGKKRADAPSLKKRLPILLLILCSAIIGGVSYLLQLVGAKNLPATVLYPFITGGSMVFSSIIGIVAFREKPSKLLLFSIGACFIGTLMFL